MTETLDFTGKILNLLYSTKNNISKFESCHSDIQKSP